MITRWKHTRKERDGNASVGSGWCLIDFMPLPFRCCRLGQCLVCDNRLMPWQPASSCDKIPKGLGVKRSKSKGARVQTPTPVCESAGVLFVCYGFWQHRFNMDAPDQNTGMWAASGSSGLIRACSPLLFDGNFVHIRIRISDGNVQRATLIISNQIILSCLLTTPVLHLSSNG